MKIRISVWMCLGALGLQGCSLPGPVTGEAGQPPAALARAVAPELTADQQVLRGRGFLQQRQWQQAQTAFRAALQAEPASREAATELAAVLGQSGQLAEAQVLLEGLLRRYPLDAQLANNLGYAHYLQGHYGEAVEVLQAAQRIDPGNLRTRNNLKLAQAALQHAVHSVGPTTELPNNPETARVEGASPEMAESQTLVSALPEVLVAVGDRLTALAEAPVEALQTLHASRAIARPPLDRAAMAAPPGWRTQPSRAPVPSKAVRTAAVIVPPRPRLQSPARVAGLPLRLTLALPPVAGPARTLAAARLPQGVTASVRSGQPPLRLRLAATFPSAVQRSLWLGAGDARSIGAAPARNARMPGPAQPAGRQPG